MPLTPFASPIQLSRSHGLRELRRQALDACETVGMPELRGYDLESAVGEAAMNAIVHAEAGMGYVSIEPAGTVRVRIVDEGMGISVENLPKATLKKGYSSAGTFGHGFKMILQTVDRVSLRTSASGTTIVMEQDYDPKSVPNRPHSLTKAEPPN